METVAARFSFLEQSLASRISADRRHLVGFHFARLFNDMMDAGRMNLTLSNLGNGLGSCDETSYSGAYDSLNRNVSDVSLFYASNPACDRMAPFDPGFLFLDSSSNIFTLKRLSTSVTKSYGLMSTIPVLIILLLFTCGMVIRQAIVGSMSQKLRRRRKRKHWYRRPKKRSLKNLWVTFWAVFCRQSCAISTRSTRVRYLFLLYSWMIAMFAIFVSSFFQTSLLIKIPVEKIDTLADLSESKYHRALFMREWNLFLWFKDSKDPVREAIWYKATGGSGSIDDASTRIYGRMTITRDMPIMFEAMKKGRSMINPFSVNRFMSDMYCFMRGEDDDHIVHISDSSFFPMLSLAIFRKDTARVIKDRIHTIFHNFNQYGFHDFYKKNPLGILRKTVDQRNCYRVMEQDRDAGDNEQAVGPIQRSHLRNVGNCCFTSLLLSLVILVCECYWSRQIRQHFDFTSSSFSALEPLNDA